MKFDRTQLYKLGPIARKKFDIYSKMIDKYPFNEYGIYSANTILFNALSFSGFQTFNSIMNEGLNAYNKCSTQSEEDKSNMRELVNKWTKMNGNESK